MPENETGVTRAARITPAFMPFFCLFEQAV
jgi:hypothetical protein